MILPIAHFTLPTRAVDRSSAFFAATLGWKPLNRPNNIPMRAAWLEIAPGQELHLVEVADFTPTHFEREYGRHIAIAHPLAGFEALKERLRANGAEVIPPLRPTPFERFFFRDPNGYVFEVVPAEREAETAGP
jgi:catechol 2,3-dioxygenase-like lactoylglutathione lyase family enzyme